MTIIKNKQYRGNH